MIQYAPTEEEVAILQDWKAANPDTASGDDKYVIDQDPLSLSLTSRA